MPRAVLITGGNLGDVRGALAAAERLIAERAGRIVARSTVVESEAWGTFRDEGGGQSGGIFLNQALVVETSLTPEELLDTLQAIEKELGREGDYELRSNHRPAPRSRAESAVRKQAREVITNYEVTTDRRHVVAPEGAVRKQAREVITNYEATTDRRHVVAPESAVRKQAREVITNYEVTTDRRHVVAPEGAGGIQRREIIKNYEVATDCGATCGRVYLSRPIDIDILFYDDLVVCTDRLTIPHPLIAVREFVLCPLAEILPDYPHPVTGETPRLMLESVCHYRMGGSQ